MDLNDGTGIVLSLSARRAWIEIRRKRHGGGLGPVALRKESVDRNPFVTGETVTIEVALRKESVDRNIIAEQNEIIKEVALRKESVDRNGFRLCRRCWRWRSLSARRAWIEMGVSWKMQRLSIRRSPQGERG